MCSSDLGSGGTTPPTPPAGPNTPPTARPDTNTVVRGGPDAPGHDDSNNATTIVAGNVIPNDNDPDGDTLTVVGVVPGTQPSASDGVGGSVPGAYGTIVITPDGSYSYTLNNNDPAVQALTGTGRLTDTFTYTISDGKGGTATTTVTITIGTTANTPPTATPDTNTVPEDGPAATGNVIPNDNDPDGDPLMVVGVVPGTHPSATGNVGSNVPGDYGTIKINTDGSYTYMPDPNNSLDRKSVV